MTVAPLVSEARLPHPLLPLALVVALAACAQFPELDTQTNDIDPNAPYPALVPLEPLVAQADAPRITDADTSATEARVAGLRGRADRLRRTGIDAASRARLQQTVAR
ncbi:hypothetical protein [Lacimonas salitolerans]|uniref:Uncharacterized protein n=1 Tax=Lacimonas salitolerans TaxID=1323750 RepID=A0ABW4EDL1_9RHOB